MSIKYCIILGMKSPRLASIRPKGVQDVTSVWILHAQMARPKDVEVEEATKGVKVYNTGRLELKLSWRHTRSN